MAIEVIEEAIEMPSIENRRYKYTCNNGNINSYWFVYDTLDNNKRVGKGIYEDMAFRCLHLNKNYYRSHPENVLKEIIK